jgi:mannitol/fructose-specific phosphotransferase system IIA component (Ntr-type)
MAGKLLPLLESARITLEIQSADSAGALREVAGLLEGHPDVIDFAGFYRDLLARERLDSTCLGNEIAVPHARTENVSRIVMAVGRSTRGVLF